MTVAAAIESRTANAPPWPKSRSLAHVELLADVDHAESVWRSFENQQHLFTPYQRFDFLRPWHQEVGAREGLHPMVVVAYDRQHGPVALLPLAVGERHGVRTARFMGGKHTTFNMGLWNRNFAKQASRDEIDLLLAAIRSRSAIDVLAFSRQPLTWQDLPNPLALLARQPSVNDCPVITIEPGAPATARISHSMRRRLKAKERKLKGLPGYRYHVAVRDDEIRRLLDAFFRIKPQRMAEQKLPNVFAEPGVEDFIRDACRTALAGGDHAIDLHALECDCEVIALFGGVADGQRFSMMFNTYTVSENARYSPGLILISHIIDHYAERGYRTLDLGVGSDGYKKLFCKASEPIFDCYVALSVRGTLAAGVMSAANRATRLVKRSPALLSFAKGLRHSFR